MRCKSKPTLALTFTKNKKEAFNPKGRRCVGRLNPVDGYVHVYKGYNGQSRLNGDRSCQHVTRRMTFSEMIENASGV
jgi:hypothetical protein